MKILWSAPFTCAFGPLVVLEEVGEPHEVRRIVPTEPRPAGYPHPRGHVPVLVDGDFVLTEAHAIMTYVGAKLLPPPGSKELARVTELCGFLAASMHIAYRQVRRPARFTDDETAWPGIKKHGFAYFTKLMAELEGRIGKGPWAIGEQYTIADPYVCILHRWGHTAELDMAKFPALAAHSERVRARPAVQRVIEREGWKPWL